MIGVGWRNSRYSGWGIFEAMDMTAAMGWENVMTLYGHDSPQDFADLVECACQHSCFHRAPT